VGVRALDAYRQSRLGGVRLRHDAWAGTSEPRGPERSRSHARARATGWIEGVQSSAAARTRLVVAEGSPVKVLLAASRSADLMVLGAPRRGDLRRVLTNRVARRCSGRAPCPVVLVPPTVDTGEPESPEREGQPHEVAG